MTAYTNFTRFQSSSWQCFNKTGRGPIIQFNADNLNSLSLKKKKTLFCIFIRPKCQPIVRGKESFRVSFRINDGTVTIELKRCSSYFIYHSRNDEFIKKEVDFAKGDK